MADLPKECLVLEISLDLVFFFAYRTFVEETIRLLLQGFDIVLIK